MPRCGLQGEANLLVLPNIDAANISYNLLKTAAGGGIDRPDPAGCGQAGACADPLGHRAPGGQHDRTDRGGCERRSMK